MKSDTKAFAGYDPLEREAMGPLLYPGRSRRQALRAAKSKKGRDGWREKAQRIGNHKGQQKCRP